MTIEIENAKIGVVGLGLMGSSIATNFLIAGHQVVGLELMPEAYRMASMRIDHHLQACDELKLLEDNTSYNPNNLHLTQTYKDLEDCDLVLESVVEDLAIKSEVIQQIEKTVSGHCVIASNTSAIPITTLQKKMESPSRFLGLHWSEPAYASRYLEIICGAHTDLQIAKQIQQVGPRWGKEPILLKKDIRGFVTNRLMYAVYREGLQILERGEANIEALDKSFRYDTGSWITMMGIFQRMDYLGIKYFENLAERTLGRLSNAKEVPDAMKKIVAEKGRGVHNQNGLYSYSQQEAEDWKEAFGKFSSELHQLSEKWLK